MRLNSSLAIAHARAFVLKSGVGISPSPFIEYAIGPRDKAFFIIFGILDYHVEESVVVLAQRNGPHQPFAAFGLIHEVMLDERPFKPFGSITAPSLRLAAEGNSSNH